MKKKIIIFSYIIISCIYTNAQSTFTVTKIKVTNNPLWSIYFTDTNTGYAVGNNGTIVKTTDGGASWLSQTSGTKEQLYSVFFINSNIGWVVGANVTILKTVNGGATWTLQSSGFSNNHYFSTYFTDENTGYITTQLGSLIKTIDGGNTWVSQTNKTKAVLFSTCFVDPNSGFAVGGTGLNGIDASSMIVLKTIDGGNTWSAITTGITDGVLFSVHFANNNVGYAAGIKSNGYAAILKTTDGGNTWLEKTIPTAYCLRSIHFINENNGFCCGDGGLTFQTTDGGNTWIDISDPNLKNENQGLYSIFFINQNLGWQVSSNGTIIMYSSSEPTITLPSIITSPAEIVTSNTATSGGTISFDGGTPISVRGVCWSTSINPTIADNKTTDGAGNGFFTSSITGLTPNTTYYVRAYATNSVGTAYGNEISFKSMEPTLPAKYSLTLTAQPADGGSLTGEGEYDVDTDISLYANPAKGYQFVNWTIDTNVISTKSNFTYTMPKNNVLLTANFRVEVSIDGQPCPGMPTVTDIDGNVYHTVQIGEQCWIKENLKVSHYNDGSTIPTGLSNVEWKNTYGASAVYPYTEIAGLESEQDVVEAYGKLYNWYAVADSRELCPTGWSVPTQSEWTDLKNYIIDNYNFTNKNVSNSLKSCRQVDSPQGEECSTSFHPRWESNENNFGTDNFGFSALPGGEGFYVGSGTPFGNLGLICYWWSRSEHDEDYAQYQRQDLSGSIEKSTREKSCGFSVRCLKLDENNPKTHILSLAVQPLNSGIVHGEGKYQPNESVTIYATPNQGFQFVSWTINGKVISRQATYTYTMPDVDVAIAATFQMATFSLDGHPCTDAETVTDIDGNTYNTIQIGGQCWLKENLKVTHYNNGNAIARLINTSTTWGAYTIYRINNIGDTSTDAVMISNYGALYNGYAVADSRGICPDGWHVPADEEWSQMTDYLTYNYDEITIDNIGNKLKSCRQVDSPLGGNCSTIEYPRWNSNNINYGTDKFNFSALPGGYYFPGYFSYFFGSECSFWTSSEVYDRPLPENTWMRILKNNDGKVTKARSWNRSARSVRCMKNADFISQTRALNVQSNSGGSTTGTGKYEPGKEVKITATPSQGYQFVNWTINNEIISAENTYIITLVDEDITIVANFEKIH